MVARRRMRETQSRSPAARFHTGGSPASSPSFRGNEKGKVNVSLYDISGRLIQNLYNGAIDNGAVKQLYADTRKMKPGVYIVRVTTSTGTTQKKLVLER